MVRPRAFAVFRLMTSSNVAGYRVPPLGRGEPHPQATPRRRTRVRAIARGRTFSSSPRAHTRAPEDIC
jgi:hypothetical protein